MLYNLAFATLNQVNVDVKLELSKHQMEVVHNVFMDVVNVLDLQVMNA